MGVEEELDPARRGALGQILVAQLAHCGDKRLDVGDTLPAVEIRLTLVEAGEGVQGGHEQERERGGYQRQQRQVGEVCKIFEGMALISKVAQHLVCRPEANEGCGHVQYETLE